MMSRRYRNWVAGTAFAFLHGALLLAGLNAGPALSAEAGYERFVGDEPGGFATPEAAVAAFVAAVGAGDLAATASVLGLDAKELAGFDGIKDRLAEIAAAAAEGTKIDTEEDTIRVVLLGNEVWAFPFPLTRREDGEWEFDTYAGLEEIINRRVGENELQAIATLRSYVDAQREYAAADRDDDGVLEFAQKLLSGEGGMDGLYWSIEQGDGESPAGPYIDPEALSGAAGGKGYFGYRFRVLTRQGDNVAGGAYDYVINSNMIAGYGLVAWPVRYADTGVNTFVVSHAGIVYEKDLGADTDKIVEGIEAFDPDDSWQIVSE